MKNRRSYIVIFYFCLFFLLKWDFHWNHFVTQNVMINTFYPPTHLKRQIDILHDKMGMDATPKTFLLISLVNTWLNLGLHKGYVALLKPKTTK